MPMTSCNYHGKRDEALVAYVFDEIEPDDRDTFEAHLPSCAQCRDELASLRGVRASLGEWSPPAFARAGSASRMPAPRWRAIPVWAQAAAATLVLGVSAGIANVDVRYDQDGLAVRTGWTKTTSGAAGASSVGGRSGAVQDVSSAAAAPWRADLTALESTLRGELQALGALQAAKAPDTPASDAEVLRRVRALVDESERRQQRELALRVADMMRDLDTRRRADLVKIDHNLGLIQNNTGVEVLKQRELLNYLVRASQNR